MSPEEIRAALARPAVEFATSGFRPTYAPTESWLGRVYLGRPGETLPFDDQGRPMLPLLQLVLAGLPTVPASLANTQALTVFVSQALPPIPSPPPTARTGCCASSSTARHWFKLRCPARHHRSNPFRCRRDPC